jgi:2-dehydropantoate 2-reductase
MRIAVVGAGGVGGYFGGRLAQSGLDVAFVARGEHLRAMQTQGLRIDDPDGKTDVFPVRATNDPAEIGPVDTVILGVKAWQVAEVAQMLKPLLHAGTFVVPLQNGVEAPMILSRELKPGNVFGGLCYLVSFLMGPGWIRHAGMVPRIAFGELDNRPSERGTRLLEVFRSIGVNAEIPPDINVAMWKKFQFIASISGVGAVARAPMGVIRSTPETRSMLESAVAEIAAVAEARGIALGGDSLQATMQVVDSLPAETTASMQRDIMEGRPSELSFQSGSVIRLAAETGTAAPVHGFFYAALLPMELRARGGISF